MLYSSFMNRSIPFNTHICTIIQRIVVEIPHLTVTFMKYLGWAKDTKAFEKIGQKFECDFEQALL